MNMVGAEGADVGEESRPGAIQLGGHAVLACVFAGGNGRHGQRI
jgi:hypothetical protein